MNKKTKWYDVGRGVNKTGKRNSKGVLIKEEAEEVCPRCNNKFWFFMGEEAVECPCVDEEEKAND